MNLKTVLKCARNLGLCAAVALVACDTGAKPEEPSKDAKADAAAQAMKDPEIAKAVADAKVAAEAAAAEVKAAEEEVAAEAKALAAVAAAEAPEEEAAPAEEPEAEAAKAEPKQAKKAEPKKAEPKAEDKAAKIDAKAIYTAKCKVCHAPDGKGAAAQQKNKIPDMSAKDWQSKHSKAAVAKAIAEGVDGTKMKAFKEKLSKEEIDAVAAFVKKM